MACLDMYNSDQHKGYCPPMSPRISFSNDFVDSQQIIKQEIRSSAGSDAPVSTDFEFSVTNYSMMSADELFFKGRLLPFKDNGNNNNHQMQRTIRDELLVDDDDNGYEGHEVSLRPPKGSTRWKGLLGLKRSHIGSKKLDKNDGSVERIGESGRHRYVHEEVHVGKSSQELLSEAGSSHRDVEIGIQ
ncbi:hypothetical protein JCGZ_12379 [Jatropha curcas]|uniref:Uncharacterized protein n=1 Tax=Jatropha curcas TaxID=180498 RepID=A0A067KA93_JATCU|nr:uncharacterized protein LOC105639694 [Jatropha curcas]KDP31918.1 hypothetical protein JCGZ_12379 [Jatropha curcas]